MIRTACQHRSVRASVASILGTAALFGLPLAATAADATTAAAEDGQQELEEVRVTGSRIVRRDLQSNSPIVTVEDQAFLEKGTLAEYRYLEHGAFYAILILSVIMYVQTLFHIPEVITGLGGATLIGISLWSSIKYNREERAEEERLARESVAENI